MRAVNAFFYGEQLVTIRQTLIAALIAFAAAGCSGGQAPDDGGAEPATTDTPDDGPEPAGFERTPAPADARLYFVSPADGAVLESPVRVEFGLENMDVVPAGTMQPMAGHHHVIVDADLPPFDMPIPADENHIHFGDGSSTAMLELEPGEHRLQLLLGDHIHVPHDPPVYSEPIKITVE